MSMFKVMTDIVKNPFLMLNFNNIGIKLASQVANVVPNLLTSDFIKLKCPLPTRPKDSSKDLDYLLNATVLSLWVVPFAHFMSFL